MSDITFALLVPVGIAYIIFGSLIAVLDISNGEVFKPKDYYEDGYNWFGSWTTFIFRTIIAAPFYIIFTLGLLVSKFVRWLFTVGR